MSAWLWIALLVPALGAGLGGLRRHAPATRWVPLPVAIVTAASGVALLVATTGGGAVSSGPLRADALSAWFLTAVGLVAVIAIWGGMPGRRVHAAGGYDGGFSALMCAFLAAMTLALLADNLGVVWVAVEATTIATAFLVGLGGGRHALEAAWKYVILGSVGVAIAFLGIVLIYAATLGGEPTLSWVELTTTARLDPTVLKFGAALAALGFATKAGLAPMHSWLPDAHSQAPAPVSGLMSGVLLSVALYAIIRVQVVADAVLGRGLFVGLLVAAGLLSLAVAGALVLAQRDFKRMLAYSSIEHMGIMALGVAAGGQLGLTLVLLHVLGHGLVKSAAFVVAGRIADAEGTHAVADVRGLLARRPDLGVPWILACAALLGFPPFVTFVTEVGILIALWQAGLAWVAADALVALLVVFVGIARHAVAMSFGAPEHPADPRLPRTPVVPVILALSLAAAATVAAWPLLPVVLGAAAVVTGGRP